MLNGTEVTYQHNPISHPNRFPLLTSTAFIARRVMYVPSRKFTTAYDIWSVPGTVPGPVEPYMHCLHSLSTTTRAGVIGRREFTVQYRAVRYGRGHHHRRGLSVNKQEPEMGGILLFSPSSPAVVRSLEQKAQRENPKTDKRRIRIVHFFSVIVELLDIAFQTIQIGLITEVGKVRPREGTAQQSAILVTEDKHTLPSTGHFRRSFGISRL